jgi:hypothetical protein
MKKIKVIFKGGDKVGVSSIINQYVKKFLLY